jgi:hypothetical protein
MGCNNYRLLIWNIAIVDTEFKMQTIPDEEGMTKSDFQRLL